MSDVRASRAIEQRGNERVKWTTRKSEAGAGIHHSLEMKEENLNVYSRHAPPECMNE